MKKYCYKNDQSTHRITTQKTLIFCWIHSTYAFTRKYITATPQHNGVARLTGGWGRRLLTMAPNINYGPKNLLSFMEFHFIQFSSIICNLIPEEIQFLYIFTPWALPLWALSTLAPFRWAPAITITQHVDTTITLLLVITFETPTNQNKT
jgi:hypothetical protein